MLYVHEFVPIRLPVSSAYPLTFTVFALLSRTLCHFVPESLLLFPLDILVIPWLCPFSPFSQSCVCPVLYIADGFNYFLLSAISCTAVPRVYACWST